MNNRHENINVAVIGWGRPLSAKRHGPCPTDCYPSLLRVTCPPMKSAPDCCAVRSTTIFLVEGSLQTAE